MCYEGKLFRDGSHMKIRTRAHLGVCIVGFHKTVKARSGENHSPGEMYTPVPFTPWTLYGHYMVENTFLMVATGLLCAVQLSSHVTIDLTLSTARGTVKHVRVS